MKSVAELVAYAKKNPGKLNYGSAGPGSTVHILTESFRRAAGIDIVHIPYRGAAPALQGLLAGDVEMLIDTVVIPHIKAGTVRGLAAVGPARLDELPDLPTLAEAGYPSVRTSGWSALFGPAKLPPELVAFYAGHVEALFKDKAFVTRLIATGSMPAFLGPAPFADYVKEDNAYFGKLIRDAGIKLRATKSGPDRKIEKQPIASQAPHSVRTRQSLGAPGSALEHGLRPAEERVGGVVEPQVVLRRGGGVRDARAS